MKRSQLALAIASLVASSASFALVNHAGTTVTPSTWASEIGTDGSQSSVLTLPGKDTNGTETLNIAFPMGVAQNAGTKRYIRIELSSGTFKEHPVCTVAPATSPQCNRTVGGKGQSYIAYEMSAGTAAIGYSASITLDLTSGGIYPANTTDPIKLTYSIHNSPQSSEIGSQKDTASIYNKEFSYVEFKKALVSEFTAGDKLISEVTQDFLTFTAGETVGKLGTFYIGMVTDTIYLVNSSGAAITSSGSGVNSNVDYLVGTGTTLELTAKTNPGFDFLQDASGTQPTGILNSTTALGRLIMTAGSVACSADYFGAASSTALTSLTADKATFSLNSSTSPYSLMTGEYTVCIKANGVSKIPTRDYVANYSPTSKNQSKPEGKLDQPFGKIVQNGTVLDTPFMTIYPGYISRVLLTNTGAVDVEYETQIFTDETATVTAPTSSKAKGKVPANSMLQINVADLVGDVINTAYPGRKRIAVRFVLTGSNKSLNGVYHAIKYDAATGGGDIQSIPLIRQGGG